MKRFIYLISFSWFVLGLSAQNPDPVLMRINGEEITRSEFEYLFNKNRTSAVSDKKSVDEYVRLFVNYKLKVVEARKLGLDTTQAFRSELAGYRQDLIREYVIGDLQNAMSARAINESGTDNDLGTLIQVKQIFKYIPQNSSNQYQHTTELLMDSLSSVIENDPACDFDQLVEIYSQDTNLSWLHSMDVPEDMEEAIFSLNKNQISKPIYSPSGIHIIKIVEKLESGENSGNTPSDIFVKKKNKYDLDNILRKLKQQYRFIPNDQAMEELCKNGCTNDFLFTIEGNAYGYSDFLRFTESNKGSKSEQLEGFITKSLLDFSLNNLEDTYPDFNNLMREYKEGMLLFEISNKLVWEKASTDKAGLKAYFSTHQKNYKWDSPRFNGLVIHAVDKKVGKQAKKMARKMPLQDGVEALTKYFNSDGVERVRVEQGLYRQGDNGFVDKIVFKKGKITPLLTHPYTTTVGKKVKAPQSYEEVLPQLVADYQDFLEAAWVKELHAKSKVEINEEVLKTVNNHSSN